MIDRFGLVNSKRLHNVYTMSQDTNCFEHEITMFVRSFSIFLMQRLVYSSCKTYLQRVLLFWWLKVSTWLTLV